MSQYLTVAVILLGALSSSSPTALDQFTKLQQQAHAARVAGDKHARLQVVLKMQELLNGAPDAVEAAAHAYAEAGDAQGALSALKEFADEGQVDEQLLDGKDHTFAMLENLPEYKSILERFERNKRAISLAEPAFTLTDPGLVAEDIAYDARSKTFLITSVLEKKILRVTIDGRATEFAQSPSHWPMLAIKVDSGRNLVWATEVALDGFATVAKADWGRSAVLCFGLRSGALLRRIEGPAHAALGDLVLTQGGDPVVSDGEGGGVYRVVNDRLNLIDGRDFISPQTGGMLADGEHMLMPDYARGVAILDLKSKQVAWLNRDNAHFARPTQKVALNGIDGLYVYGRWLILTQNGTSPERVTRLELDGTLMRVVAEQIIEQATPTLGDPTHGVIVGDFFYYIANSGWSALDEHGVVKPGATLNPARLMRFRLR
jgi:sugar lactone lactonase YvrE